MQRLGAVKIVLIGDAGVGKTTLRRQFMGEKQTNEYLMTIGADFAKKDVIVVLNNDKFLVECLIWDMAGQDLFTRIRHEYYRSAMGALLVVDISRRGTFENAEKWITELWRFSGSKPVPIVFLMNKSDLEESNPDIVLETVDRDILIQNIRGFCQKKALYAYPFYKTSAIQGTNIDQAFEALLNEIVTTEMKSTKNNQY